MSQTDPKSQSQSKETPVPLSPKFTRIEAEKSDDVKLSPEFKVLEKRLNSAMLININKCITEALKPIQDSIAKIVNSSALIDQQEIEIKRLNEENSLLKNQVCELRNDVDSIKLTLNNLENKSLECNLIFQGNDKSLNKTDEALKEKIYLHTADTYNYHDQHDRIAAARACSICRCRRLGRPNPSRP